MVKSGSRLEIADVAFAYGAVPVLRDLSVALAPGERVALLGPNGAGKSTLLNLIAGALRPGEGRMTLDGADLVRMEPRERARRVAMVPQNAPAPFAFTVRELVSLGRTPYLSPLRGERTEDREAVERAMRQAEVESLTSRLLGELSGGERQRAALALALAQEPSLLLLDEPTAHLDLHHQTAILGRVRELNREEGLTVLAAIHDMNLSALWFERIVVLDEGRLVADGTPGEVLEPALIERVFRARVEVLTHPSAGTPLVALAHPRRDMDKVPHENPPPAGL